MIARNQRSGSYYRGYGGRNERIVNIYLVRQEAFAVTMCLLSREEGLALGQKEAQPVSCKRSWGRKDEEALFWGFPPC